MKKLVIVIPLISFAQLIFSQNRKINSEPETIISNSVAVSKTQLTDDANFPVSLVNAAHDIKKNNLPYFSQRKVISKSQAATATLKKVQVVLVPGNISEKILSYYKNFLSNDFTTQTYYAQSGRDYISFVKIYPYRINSENKIEELVSYEFDWETNENNIAAQKVLTSTTFTTSSVLANGNWYKIGLTKNGIYKLDKAFLKKTGIDPDAINPKNIRVYGNGGHMLPESNNTFRYDDLQENAIIVSGENDNTFDNNDYILFYGQATNQWTFDKNHTLSCLDFYHQLNYYSDTSYYFITTDLGPGKRIGNQATLSIPATNATTTYDYYDYHEQNTTNFIKSGSEFYGEYFDFTSSYAFSYPVPNLVVGDTIKAFVNLAARGASPSTYNFSYSGNTFSFNTGIVNLTDYTGRFADITNYCSKALCNNSSLLGFSIAKQTPSTVGWFDKLIFNCRRNLTFNNSQFSFRDCRTIGIGNTTNFSLNTNNFSNIFIWDISDITAVKNQLFNLSGSQLDFTINNDSLHEFVVCNGSDYLEPSFITKVSNQNLHSIPQADYVIVCYPGFLSQAQKLAQLHQQEEGLTSAVVTSEQVYNEFSSGKPDPVAIRDFTRMLYNRNFSIAKEVKYLLLFGDGSYKVKDRYSANNTSLLPVYETGNPKENSWDPSSSTACDDFYGWMNDTEGDSWGNALVDVGVGRFPVKNMEEAIAAVSKVEAYYKKNYNYSVTENENSCIGVSNYPQGEWRNQLVFIGDDEDGQTHMFQSDLLATKVKTEHPEFNIDKIYADAFIQQSTPGGNRYPDVSSAIDRRFEKGSLILNYMGHGGEVGLGHERYLEVSQIQSYTNKNNLPLFITATCEFSRYDDPDRTSAGELCFLNPNGGAIAMLTTARLAYTIYNYELVEALYDNAFDTLSNGKMPALGDIVKLTKSQIGINIQYLNFHLLGDPALRLAYPQQKVFTTSINNKTVTSSVYDTISALSKVTIKGFVGDKNGNKLSSFNGVLFPTVFDKEQQISCLGNDPASLSGGQPFKFSLQKNIIYKGKVQVTNGDFLFSFIVPKDISYNFDLGRLSYYAHNGVTDAGGFNSNFYIGGSAKNVTPDNAGPILSLYLNDKKFVSGGTTNEKPNLYAEAIDSSGINTVGTGIGHDILAILDENTNKPIVLNDYYQADLNSYQSGKVRYPFDELAEGNHRLSLKVWDVQNNSSTVYTDFIVAPSADIALTHALNYPNPFTTKTQFFFENNQCCQTLKINIQIFTVSGKIVKTISETATNEGFRSNGISWDGKDDFGDKLAKGIYIYKLSVIGHDNKTAEKIEKLVILN